MPRASKLWYLVPLIFSILGGIIAWFVLRKTDPQTAKNCLILGIIMFVLGMIINAVASMMWVAAMY